MPNWCECEMTARGTKVAVDAFVAGLRQEDAKPGEDESQERFYRVLESYAPMPEPLEETASPPTLFATEAERDAYNAGKDPEWAKAMTYAQRTDLLAVYGTDNWYDWQLTHWGVKWGDCRATLERTGPRRAFLAFEAPWCPPIEGMDAVAAKFPMLAFCLRYWECGCAFKGEAKWSAGEREYNCTEPYHGRRGG